jgi:hypothetical protein
MPELIQCISMRLAYVNVKIKQSKTQLTLARDCFLLANKPNNITDQIQVTKLILK